MKHSHSPRGTRLIAGMVALTSACSQTFAETGIPTGTLNVDRNLVQVGTRVQLDWQIEYPSGGVTDLVTIAPPNIIQPKSDLKMRVRVLGVSFVRAKNNNGHGNNLDGVDCSNPSEGGGGPNGTTDPSGTVDDEKKGTTSYTILPAEVVWSCNDSSWQSIFYGDLDSTPSCSLALETMVSKGDNINFGARGYESAWLPLHNTAVSSPNITVLKNGDGVPAIPAFQTKQIKKFLRPYLSSDFKSVKIGSRELLLFCELDQTDPMACGFDLQDLVVLVTFE